jgi:hypothetical protein
VPSVLKALLFTLLVPAALAGFFLRERLRKSGMRTANLVLVPLVLLVVFAAFRNLPLFALGYCLTLVGWSFLERRTRHLQRHRPN